MGWPWKKAKYAASVDAQRFYFSHMVRNLVEAIVLVIAFGLLSRCFLLKTYYIPSGSMAPALLGPHWETICQECHLPLCWSAEIPPRLGDHIHCPQCGFAKNPYPDKAFPGDQVFLLPSTFVFRNPQRWEVVAFRSPFSPHSELVKRVVGLPGETVKIQNGEILVDGHLVRKPLALQRELAHLIYDSNHDPEGRFFGLSPQNPLQGWTPKNGSFLFRKPENSSLQPFSPLSADWLVYQGSQSSSSGGSNSSKDSIPNQSAYTPKDKYLYNQDMELSEPETVSDLMISFQLSLQQSDSLWIRGGWERKPILLCFSPPSRVTLWNEQKNNEPTDKKTLQASSLPGEELWEGELEVSWIDKQIVVSVNQETVFQEELIDQDFDSPLPFGLSIEGDWVELKNLKLWRDIHYRLPAGVSTPLGTGNSIQVPSGNVLVLGDNSSWSEDSRQWPSPGTVPLKNLLGKPLAYRRFGSPKKEGQPHAGFQVPVIGEMGYIR